MMNLYLNLMVKRLSLIHTNQICGKKTGKYCKKCGKLYQLSEKKRKYRRKL